MLEVGIMDIGEKIKGTIYQCDDETSFKETLRYKIPEDYSVLAIKNDFTDLKGIYVTEEIGEKDLSDPSIKGHSYFLFIQALLSNPEHRAQFDKYIEEVILPYYENTEFRTIQ